VDTSRQIGMFWSVGLSKPSVFRSHPFDSSKRQILGTVEILRVASAIKSHVATEISADRSKKILQHALFASDSEMKLTRAPARSAGAAALTRLGEVGRG
jgi:hypothetical protein